MKDKNWTDIVSKQGDLRHFASMAIRKSGKSEHTSAQEIDFLPDRAFGRTTDPKTDYQRYGHQ